MMEQKALETIDAVISGIIFKNEENGYTVARARLLTGEEITLVGVMPFLGCAEEISAKAVVINHHQYGRQYQVVEYERSLPSDTSGIYEYLASRTIKGIGPKTARAIVNAFGNETFDVLANYPEKLGKISGISMKKAREIQHSYLSQTAFKRLIEFLAEYNLPFYFSVPLMQLYGDQAAQIIEENPYILCSTPFDYPFEKADMLAFGLGYGEENPQRLDGALLYALNHNLQNGHCFVPRDKLVQVSSNLCGIDGDTLESRLSILLDTGRVVEEDILGLNAIFLFEAHTCETFLAEEIARLAKMKAIPPPGIEKLLKIEAEQGSLEYSDLQQQAMLMCFNSAISLITGGPGTGKTTALKVMVSLLKQSGFEVALAAPTGRAAKNMSERCGIEAKTIHRLLEAGFDESGGLKFAKNNENPLSADVIIIDEASMLDIFLAASLFKAMRPHARLVLVGDCDQLPPVGPGSFFADLLAVLPSVRLTEIFRQAQNSDIIVNAHKINGGIDPDLHKNAGDMYFASTRSAEQTISAVITLISERIPLRFGIEPNDIQVICQSRMPPCGTEVFNVRLQQALNPPQRDKSEIPFGNRVFRQGDKVMQVRNNYNRTWQRMAQTPDGDSYLELSSGVYNGDIGQIIAVDKSAQIIKIAFDEKECDYSFDDLDELEHAFAITTHKAQGSEYPAVIIPAFSAPQRLLNRSLLYTAVTRAKSHLTIVGREEFVKSMIMQNKINKRYGALKIRIKGLL